MTRIEIRARYRNWIVPTVVVAITVFAVSAYAFGGRHHGEGHRAEFREFMLNKVLDRADANEEQRAQILAIVRTAHEDVAELREGTRDEIHEQMFEILTAETVDGAALDALRSEHQQKMTQALDHMTGALVEASNVLSQEQRIAVAEALRERFESHGHRGRFF